MNPASPEPPGPTGTSSLVNSSSQQSQKLQPLPPSVKAKMFALYRRTGQAPKAVRLGFHDCLKYADGTGGCDGCLNWTGMEVTATAA